ncbi:hypothetical protein B0A55_00123 [Friedmanniomyces simplex]|uniref:BHLH domain-containing protein n=1 Tax=Friedmanniomyces simplex TaxID=329884 RepID=A0A4U0Y0K3_9PEZI|nr:hypothetical protein B0A55_00123 [Friedmanniomyces simplex]
MTSSGYTTSRDAQLPLQSYVLADHTYDNSSFPAITEVQRAHGSEDDDLTSRIPDTAGTSQADLMETPQPLSSVGDAQRTTKRAPGGELVRPKGRRLPHNLIERRYRDNLNHQIEVLRDELPTFKSIVACTADIEDPTALAGKWPSKAVVIAAAIQYIAQLEQERGKAITRNTLLCAQVEGLQKLVRCDDCSIVKYLEAMKPRVLFGQ